MKEHEKLGQKLVSKVTLHFFGGATFEENKQCTDNTRMIFVKS